MRSSRNKSKGRIRLKDPIFVEIKPYEKEVLVLNSETGMIYQFSDLPGNVIKIIHDAGEVGITEDELLCLVRGSKRKDAAKSFLFELSAADVIKGYKPSVGKRGKFAATVALGAFSLGSSFVFPLDARAAPSWNCLSPTCAQRGGTCAVNSADPTDWICYTCIGPGSLIPYSCTHPCTTTSCSMAT